MRDSRVKRSVILVFFSLMLLAATACGRSRTNGTVSSAARSQKASSSVAVVPLNEAGLPDASLPNPFSFSQTTVDGATTYAVYSSQAYGTHVYLQVSYDPAKLVPSSVSYGEALGDASKVLFLAVTTKPGMIPIGVWKLPGTPATSDAKKPIATVTFGASSSSAGGWKGVSVAPTGTANEVSDLHVVNTGGTSYHLTWTEKLQGDYNVDGDVSIADLAPIAQYYGQTVTGATDPANLADGNGDGQVSITDLAPIAADYSAHMDGYIVQRSDDGGTTWLPSVISYANEIQPIFDASCIACHGTSGGLTLTSGGSYGNLVNVVSGESPPEVYVKPGDPTNSYLWNKLSPGTHPPTGALTGAQLTLIQDWILGGATTGADTSSPNFVVRPGTHLPYAHPQYSFDDTTTAASPQWRVVAFGDGAPGAISPAVGPGAPPDTTPPVWDTTTGIQSAAPNATNPSTQVDVTFGSATDAQSPPVHYIVSYVQGDATNFSNPANIHAQVYSPAGSPPFTETVGGLTPSTLYSFRVNAADSATPPNVDGNTVTLSTTTGAPANAAPELSQQIQGIPNPANTGQDVVLTVIATDADPTDTLIFTWDDGDAANGTFSGQSESGTNATGVTSTIHWQSATAKTFSITCSVSDGVNAPVNATLYSMVVNSAPPPVSYATDIQPIFDSRCTGCHSGPGASAGLDLSSGLSYGMLVDVVSTEASPELRVKPNDPTNSYLWNKVSSDAMPPGSPLTSAQKTSIQTWIQQGALDN